MCRLFWLTNSAVVCERLQRKRQNEGVRAITGCITTVRIKPNLTLTYDLFSMAILLLSLKLK
jgi:hypothetical protein